MGDGEGEVLRGRAVACARARGLGVLRAPAGWSERRCCRRVMVLRARVPPGVPGFCDQRRRGRRGRQAVGRQQAAAGPHALQQGEGEGGREGAEF